MHCIYDFKENLINHNNLFYKSNIKKKRFEGLRQRIEKTAAQNVAKFHPNTNSLALAKAKQLITQKKGEEASSILLKLELSKDSAVDLEATYLYAKLKADGCGDLQKDAKAAECILDILVHETPKIPDFLRCKAQLTLAQIIQQTNEDREYVISMYEELIFTPRIVWETILQAKLGLAKLLLQSHDLNSEFDPIDLLIDVAKDKAAIPEVVEAQLYLTEMYLTDCLPKEIEKTETKEFLLQLLENTASNPRHIEQKDSVQFMIKTLTT